MTAGGRSVGFLHQLGDLPAGPDAFVGQSMPVEFVEFEQSRGGLACRQVVQYFADYTFGVLMSQADDRVGLSTQPIRGGKVPPTGGRVTMCQPIAGPLDKLRRYLLGKLLGG
jgi:hypothetical protein